MFCLRVTSIFCLVFLCAAGRPMAGQERRLQQSGPSEPWKAGDEITMSGLVQEVLTQHPAGGPAGFNFVMTGAQKPLTVNAGFGLGESARSQLRSGVLVQVIGLTRTMNGQSYLLARRVVVGGQTIQVRSRNGFPVHAVPSSGKTEVRSRSVQNNLQGGAR